MQRMIRAKISIIRIIGSMEVIIYIFGIAEKLFFPKFSGIFYEETKSLITVL